MRAPCRRGRGRSPRRSGCLLAEDVAADLDLPPFDKALVDGYAVRSRRPARAGDRRLPVGEEITAGRTPTRPLGPREAAAIMTGAPLPAGADAVVMIEQTRRIGDVVVIDDPAVAPGQNRLTARPRDAGRRGRPARRASGSTPPRLGVLASVGRTEVAGHPAAPGRRRPDGRRAGRTRPGPGPGPDPQLERGRCSGRWRVAAGAEAEALPIAPDEPEPAPATPCGAGSRPTSC